MYDVSIEIMDKEVHFSCNCPYASEGEMCKHMAAVMIVADEANVKEENSILPLYNPQLISDYKNQKDILTERLKSISFDDLKEFLIKSLLKDEALKRTFMMQFMSDEVDIKSMVEIFQSIVDEYLGYDGYINYRKASDFFSEIKDYMNDLRELLKRGSTIEVATILSEITHGFDEIPLDDSDGWSEGFYEDVDLLIQGIITDDVPEANTILYNWIEKTMADSEAWHLKEWVEYYWRAQYSEEELLDMDIANLERQIASNDKVDFRGRYSYSFIHDLMELVKLKEQRGDSESEILDLLKPYENTNEVIWYLIKTARKHGDDFKEEALLNKGLSSAQSSYGSTHEFDKALCRFYQNHRNEDKYREFLVKLVINCSQDLSFFNEYKGLYEKSEWVNQRQHIINKIISKGKSSFQIADIYVQENMEQALFEWLQENKRLETLKRYHKNLSDT